MGIAPIVGGGYPREVGPSESFGPGLTPSQLQLIKNIIEETDKHEYSKALSSLDELRNSDLNIPSFAKAWLSTASSYLQSAENAWAQYKAGKGWEYHIQADQDGDYAKQLVKDIKPW